MLSSPSVSGLHNILDSSSELEFSYNVKFNQSKSKYITFSQRKNIGSPELCIRTMLNLTMYNLSGIWGTFSRVI